MLLLVASGVALRLVRRPSSRCVCLFSIDDAIMEVMMVMQLCRAVLVGSCKERPAPSSVVLIVFSPR